MIPMNQRLIDTARAVLSEALSSDEAADRIGNELNQAVLTISGEISDEVLFGLTFKYHLRGPLLLGLLIGLDAARRMDGSEGLERLVR